VVVAINQDDLPSDSINGSIINGPSQQLPMQPVDVDNNSDIATGGGAAEIEVEAPITPTPSIFHLCRHSDLISHPANLAVPSPSLELVSSSNSNKPKMSSPTSLSFSGGT
jgi:hypothetical protein